MTRLSCPLLALSGHPAFGGKADMPQNPCPLFWSLLGVKRTYPFALHMSAYDPKRTFRHSFDHFVGADEQRRRHGKAERLGGLEVNH
jgi:hypothetical protein